MTPTERARRLIQDIITKYALSNRWVRPEAVAGILTEQLAVIPRTHLPRIKYIEADQAYEHTLGSCHESFGSAAAMDVAAEWVAIAEHMAARESVDHLEQDAMALYTARRLEDGMLPPDGWPNETVHAAWLTVARAIRGINDHLDGLPGDADLTGMDS